MPTSCLVQPAPKTRALRIIHANFGINRLNSLRAMAASVKHKYYAKNTVNCHLKALHSNYINVMSSNVWLSPTVGRIAITNTTQNTSIFKGRGPLKLRICIFFSKPWIIKKSEVPPYPFKCTFQMIKLLESVH